MSLLKWALILAIAAGIAAIFGFGGISEGLAGIAKVLFAIFLVGVVIFGALGFAAYKKIT